MLGANGLPSVSGELLNALGSIDKHSDVDTTTTAPQQNDFLKYDGTNWVPDTVPAASVAALDDIGDVTITSATNDYEVVRYDSGNSRWINAQLTAAQVDNSAGTLLESANNLSDLVNDATARSNLGLGTAAQSAATDFLAVANNLSDLADDATARSNLGLGTAATSATTDFLSGTGADTLGGDLDVGSSSIVTTSNNNNIKLAPHGSGKVEVRGDGVNQDGAIELKCSQNTHGVTIKSPAHGAYAGSWTLTLPVNDGDPNQVLTSDGNGNTSWTTASGGGASRPDVDTTLTNVGSPHSLTAPASTSTLEEIYIVDSSSGAVTINLPAVATALEGFKYNIKRVGANNVVIAANGTNTIEGSTNDQTLSVDYSALTLVCDGSAGWYII